jgi:hypothetical protein
VADRHDKGRLNIWAFVLIGAGVGGAGAAQSIAILGFWALPVLPVFIVLGALAGLAWWGIRKIAED